MVVLWNNIFFLFYENLSFSTLRPPLNAKYLENDDSYKNVLH